MPFSFSKSKVDKAGRLLSDDSYKTIEELIEAEEAFGEFRTSHLGPLTQVTISLQRWLEEYGTRYYIAQRLKRRPQILRKLRRLHARLTQLQDIGGCRIIVDKNVDVDRLGDFLAERITQGSEIELVRGVDYREEGRDDSGYRALHLILRYRGAALELQVRSRVQHFWAESIERASVVYGHYLKELEGDPRVISYFKALSHMFHEYESSREPDMRQRLALEQSRIEAEAIIRASAKGPLDSHVNETIIKTLVEVEKSRGEALNNWLLIFDWNQGNFVSWTVVDRDAEAAANAYGEAERQFRAEEGYEVVMIGSTNVATVRETHSHYFGIAATDRILEEIESSIGGLVKKVDFDLGARQILMCLYRRKTWSKSIRESNLKNHFCKDVRTFDSSFQLLIDKGLLTRSPFGDAVSLNIKRKNEIETLLGL